MKLKKLFALILSAIMICSAVSIPVSAEDTSQIITDEVSPAYENADSVKTSLTISLDTAKCNSSCTGNSDVVQIHAQQTLQKHVSLWIWDDVKGASWSGTVNGRIISLSNTKSGLSSGTYRLKTTFTLTTSSGKTETITVYSDEKTV